MAAELDEELRDNVSKLLLGLDVVHASTVLWLFSVGIAFAQLRALVALRHLLATAAAAAGQLKETLRSHPALANPFFETEGPQARLIVVGGPALVVIANLVPVFAGIELLYTATLPALVSSSGNLTLATSYFVGQVCVMAAAILLVSSYRHYHALLQQAASSYAVGADKTLVMTAVDSCDVWRLFREAGCLVAPSHVTK